MCKLLQGVLTIRYMTTLHQHDHLSQMADAMGISLYERFNDKEAAKFLQIHTDTLVSLRKQKKIGCLRVTHNQVEYFGAHLLEYLLSVSQSACSVSTKPEKDVILRMPQVAEITGLSRTTLWRYEREGIFPTRIALGGGSVGWYQSDVDQWVSSRKKLTYHSQLS